MRVENIGPHQLYLADCFEVMPTLGRVDHIIADAPYESIMHKSKDNMKGLVRPDGSHHWKPLGFGPIDEIRSAFVSVSADMCDGWFIVFSTAEGVGRWADEINPSAMKYKRACVWIKPDSTPQMNGQGPAQGAENFVCAWAGNGYARWNGGGKRGVYTYPTNSRNRSGHPTEKPLGLMRDLVSDFTNPGQTVLDPFMGSGTTGYACAMLGRKFIGVEINEKWFDIACEQIAHAHANRETLFETPVDDGIINIFEETE